MPDYNSPYTGVQVDAAVGKAIAITATPAEINAAVDKVGDITPTAAEINAAVQKVGDITSTAEAIDNTVDVITDNGASDGDILTATGDGGVEYRTPAPVSWDDIDDKPTTYPPSEHQHEISDIIGLEDELNDKVDKISGKGLSTNDYTTADKNKLDGIEAGAEVNEIDTIAAGANVTVTKNGKTVTISASGGDYNYLTNKPQIAGTTLTGNKTLSELGAASSADLSSLSGRVDLIDAAYGEAIDNLDERLNDAVSDIAAKYTKPSRGIPKDDLASAVQTSLGRADSALQSVPSTYRTATAQDIIDNGKVDKVSGKGLSTNDYTTADKNKVAAFAALGIPVPTVADAGKVLGVNTSGQYALISLLQQHTVTLAGISGTPTAFYVKTPAGDTYYEPGDTITVYDGTTLTCQAYYGPSNNWIKLNGTTVAEGAPAIYNLVVTGDATITLSGAPGSGGQMTIVMG